MAKPPAIHCQIPTASHVIFLPLYGFSSRCLISKPRPPSPRLPDLIPKRRSLLINLRQATYLTCLSDTLNIAADTHQHGLNDRIGIFLAHRQRCQTQSSRRYQVPELQPNPFGAARD